jgi:hypothetical protein
MESIDRQALRISWRGVDRGLLLRQAEALLGGVALVLGWVVLFGVWVESWGQFDQPASQAVVEQFTTTLSWVTGIPGLLAGVLSLAGKFLCCTAPRASGARGWAEAALVLALLAAFALVPLAVTQDSLEEAAQEMGPVLLGAAAFILGASLVSEICFLAFLSRTGTALGGERLVRAVPSFVGLVVVTVMVAVAAGTAVVLHGPRATPPPNQATWPGASRPSLGQVLMPVLLLHAVASLAGAIILTGFFLLLLLARRTVRGT